MEAKMLVFDVDCSRRILMRVDQIDWRKLLRNVTKASHTILLIACFAKFGGAGLQLNAQILTKEDLQKEIVVYEAASLHAGTSDMSAVQAGQIWSHLGTLYQDAGMYGQSERAFEQAMRLLTIAPVSKPDLATAIDNLGTLYMETGNVKEAEQAESKALKIREGAGLKSELPRSWYHLATLYLREHRPQEARDFSQRAVDAFFADANVVPEDRTGSLLVLASSLCQSHQYTEAIEKLQRALRIATQTYGPNQFPTGLSTFLLGYAYWKSGDLARASELMQRGSDIIGKELGSEHPAYLTVMTQYAQFLRDEHKQDVAKAIELQVKQKRAQLNANPAYSHTMQIMDVAALF
jgi:tetratricopeptide (TPR) repeat protein